MVIYVDMNRNDEIEALNLMGIQENLVTPRHGEPLVAATQDFLTTAYLITQRDVFYDRAQFCHICTYLNNGIENMVLPPPAILKVLTSRPLAIPAQLVTTQPTVSYLTRWLVNFIVMS
jgi:DNA-directed RNA polymerase III subunit RPC1